MIGMSDLEDPKKIEEVHKFGEEQRRGRGEKRSSDDKRGDEKRLGGSNSSCYPKVYNRNENGSMSDISNGQDMPPDNRRYSQTSTIKLKNLVLKQDVEDGTTKYKVKKLDECAHFHYEFVELKRIELVLMEENLDEANSEKWIVIQVTSGEKQWRIRQSYDSLHRMDKQLHSCIFKRTFSLLPELNKDLIEEEGSIRVRSKICIYLERFSLLPLNRINCGPILSWMEMDNRGNRVILTDSESAINIPAVGAALSTKRYIARASDELSFDPGEVLSIIDKPSSEESSWWRGKKKFEVGFFPSDCVALIGVDRVPEINVPEQKPVLTKRGKLISMLIGLLSSRPNRTSLRETGIVKERLFGCDLGEHLLNSGENVPLILKCCARDLEVHGIVDGIYRHSGATTTIQKLRNIFDEEKIPQMTGDDYLQDIHSISSLLKMYFRELPNPLLTYQLYNKFIEAVGADTTANKLVKMCDVVKQLPPPHYRTAEFLFRHLAFMASQDSITSMHCKNLAFVWAPNLLRSMEIEHQEFTAEALRSVGEQAVVTEFLIVHVNEIFAEDSQSIDETASIASARSKANAITSTPRLLSLEEAQGRRSLSSTSQTKPMAYIEVGGGVAAIPPKYHTVIDLPKDKRKLREKLPSPSRTSRFKSLFNNKNRSTSFKDENDSSSFSSASAKTIRKSYFNEQSPKEKRMTGSYTENNMADSWQKTKRLSSSCDIPPQIDSCQLERRDIIKNSAKKPPLKQRAASIDVPPTDIRSLLYSGDPPEGLVQHSAQNVSVSSMSPSCDLSSSVVVTPSFAEAPSLPASRSTGINLSACSIKPDEPNKPSMASLSSISSKSENDPNDLPTVSDPKQWVVNDAYSNCPDIRFDHSNCNLDRVDNLKRASITTGEAANLKSKNLIRYSGQNYNSSSPVGIQSPTRLLSADENDLISWRLCNVSSSRDLLTELSPKLDSIWRQSGLAATTSTQPIVSPFRIATMAGKMPQQCNTKDHSPSESLDLIVPCICDSEHIPSLSPEEPADPSASVCHSKISESMSYPSMSSSIGYVPDTLPLINSIKESLNQLSGLFSDTTFCKSPEDSTNALSPARSIDAKKDEDDISVFESISPPLRVDSVAGVGRDDSMEDGKLSDAALGLFSFDSMYSGKKLLEAKHSVADENGYVYTSYSGTLDRDALQSIPNEFPYKSTPDESLSESNLWQKDENSPVILPVGKHSSSGGEASFAKSPSFERNSSFAKTPSVERNPSFVKSPSFERDPSFAKSPSFERNSSFAKNPSVERNPSFAKSPSFDINPSFDRSPCFDSSAVFFGNNQEVKNVDGKYNFELPLPASRADPLRKSFSVSRSAFQNDAPFKPPGRSGYDPPSSLDARTKPTEEHPVVGKYISNRPRNHSNPKRFSVDYERSSASAFEESTPRFISASNEQRSDLKPVRSNTRRQFRTTRFNSSGDTENKSREEKVSAVDELFSLNAASPTLYPDYNPSLMFEHFGRSVSVDENEMQKLPGAKSSDEDVFSHFSVGPQSDERNQKVFDKSNDDSLKSNPSTKGRYHSRSSVVMPSCTSIPDGCSIGSTESFGSLKDRKKVFELVGS